MKPTLLFLLSAFCFLLGDLPKHIRSIRSHCCIAVIKQTTEVCCGHPRPHLPECVCSYLSYYAVFVPKILYEHADDWRSVRSQIPHLGQIESHIYAVKLSLVRERSEKRRHRVLADRVQRMYSHQPQIPCGTRILHYSYQIRDSRPSPSSNHIKALHGVDTWVLVISHESKDALQQIGGEAVSQLVNHDTGPVPPSWRLVTKLVQSPR